ncbi:hypothetical protein V6Z11_D08G144600 [Gossypium hirsutum]
MPHQKLIFNIGGSSGLHRSISIHRPGADWCSLHARLCFWQPKWPRWHTPPFVAAQLRPIFARPARETKQIKNK